ncbi:MAG: ATP phosphoribosyltransferase regulatory subunit [Lachnospiraceae bacterium]|nr:ATP phosphoribosyltransferase regulatory subunit [Lachnospiraceae bacterium]
MRDNKLHTPFGVRDILPDECAIKKYVQNQIEGVFKKYGYVCVESPVFEYIEVFSDEKMGSVSQNQMYKFFDGDGSILALRSDMTPPIARIAATAYSKYDKPLRFYYMGEAYRDNEDYKGMLREFSQAGVELMGSSSLDADGEVLLLAVDSLLASGINDFKINIGQVKFFKAILEETGLSEENCETLKDLIGKGNYVGVKYMAEKSNMPLPLKEFFCNLYKFVGGEEILKKAEGFTKNKKALETLLEMRSLYETLKLYNIEKYFVFDLGMVNKLNYYTGIIFRGYTYGTGNSVLDGGRYDNLVEEYGVKKAAIGFCVKINGLVDVIKGQKINVGIKSTDVLVAYDENGREKAFELIKTLRDKGIYSELSLIGTDVLDSIEYAGEKGIGKLLYVSDGHIEEYETASDSLIKKETFESFGSGEGLKL